MTTLCPGCLSLMSGPRCEGCRAAGRLLSPVKRHKSRSTILRDRRRREEWRARRRAEAEHHRELMKAS